MNVYQEKKDVQEERLESVASLDGIGADLAKDIAKKQLMLDLIHAEKARKVNEYIGHDVDYLTLCHYAESSFKNGNQGKSSTDFREYLQSIFDNKLIQFNKVISVGRSCYGWSIYFDFIPSKAIRQKHFALDVSIPGKLAYEDLAYQNDGKLTLFRVGSNGNLEAFAASYKLEDIKKAFEEEVSQE